MILTIGEKVTILLKRQDMSLAQLAEKMGISRQNLSNKMSRDNFTEQDARQIAVALGTEFNTIFRYPDGTEI